MVASSLQVLITLLPNFCCDPRWGHLALVAGCSGPTLTDQLRLLWGLMPELLYYMGVNAAVAACPVAEDGLSGQQEVLQSRPSLPS